MPHIEEPPVPAFRRPVVLGSSWTPDRLRGYLLLCVDPVTGERMRNGIAGERGRREAERRAEREHLRVTDNGVRFRPSAFRPTSHGLGCSLGDPTCGRSLAPGEQAGILGPMPGLPQGG